MHPPQAAVSEGHMYVGAEVVNTEDGTTDGGLLTDAVGVGAGGTGLVGMDGVVGGDEQLMTSLHSSQLQVSNVSMNDPQLPQLLEQASIWLQTIPVSSPHVVSPPTTWSR